MTIDFARIFSTDYLFNLNPGPFLPIVFKVIVPILGLLVIGGIVFKKIGENNDYIPVKKFFNKLYKFLFTMGMLGLLYVFFRQIGAHTLSAPFWLLLWGLGIIVWTLFILKYYFTDRAETIERIKKEKERKKYLP